MVRMRDVLKSARDVMRDSPSQRGEGGDNEYKFRFPPPAPRPTTPDHRQPASSELERKDLELVSAKESRLQEKQKPIAPPYAAEPHSSSKDLYHSAIAVVDTILISVSQGNPLDLELIEHQSELFVDSLSDGDQLFMQALSARRTIVSLAQHSTNVAVVAIKIGAGMQYKREKKIEVGLAGMIHEIGMLRVPQDVVNKKCELTPSEYELIKQHPIHGRNILERYSDLYPFLPIVIVQEHERWDGNGYPFGLKENEIHEYAQILGLADMFVALTHLRHYRDNFIAYKAIQSIIERRNLDFSAKMIKTLIDVISIFPVHSLVKLNDGCVAKVIQTNKNFPVRPVIEVIMDARGNKLATTERLDLSKEPMIYIVSPVLDENAY